MGLNFLQAMAETALGKPAHRPYAEQEIALLLDDYLGDLRRCIEHTLDLS